jgi:hypothetical protein
MIICFFPSKLGDGRRELILHGMTRQLLTNSHLAETFHSLSRRASPKAGDYILFTLSGSLCTLNFLYSSQQLVTLCFEPSASILCSLTQHTPQWDGLGACSAFESERGLRIIGPLEFNERRGSQSKSRRRQIIPMAMLDHIKKLNQPKRSLSRHRRLQEIRMTKLHHLLRLSKPKGSPSSSRRRQIIPIAMLHRILILNQPKRSL